MADRDSAPDADTFARALREAGIEVPPEDRDPALTAARALAAKARRLHQEPDRHDR